MRLANFKTNRLFLAVKERRAMEMDVENGAVAVIVIAQFSDKGSSLHTPSHQRLGQEQQHHRRCAVSVWGPEVESQRAVAVKTSV